MQYVILDRKTEAKMHGNSDTLQLIYTEGLGKTREARSSAKRNLLCTLFLLFILITMFAMTYVVFQGTRQHSNKVDYIMKSDDHKKFAKWPVKMVEVPPASDKARTARFVVHTALWATMSTNSLHLPGYPFGALLSISDGTVDNSTGNIYMYTSPMTPEVKDTEKDPRVSILVTEASWAMCSKRKIDFEDPRCAKVLLVGKFERVPQEELPFAEKAFFSKHPKMRGMPSGHKFFFAKIKIEKIEVLSYFGGASVVTPEEYFASKP